MDSVEFSVNEKNLPAFLWHMIIGAAVQIYNSLLYANALQTKIHTVMYPQVHDYYEIVLVTMGKMLYDLDGRCFVLEEGGLLFVRPGETHSKNFLGACHHINLSFPVKTVEALFSYLYDRRDFELFLQAHIIPPVVSMYSVISHSSMSSSGIKLKVPSLARSKDTRTKGRMCTFSMRVVRLSFMS